MESLSLSSLKEDAACEDYSDMPTLYPEVFAEEVGVEDYEFRLPPILSPQVPVLRRSLRIMAKVRRNKPQSRKPRIDPLRKITLEEALNIRNIPFKEFQFCTKTIKNYVKTVSSRKVHVISLASKLEPTSVGEELVPQSQEEPFTPSTNVHEFLNPPLNIDDLTIKEFENILEKIINELNDPNFVACVPGSCDVCNLFVTSGANESISELKKLILAATQTDARCETQEIVHTQASVISSDNEPHNDPQQQAIQTEVSEVLIEKEVIVIEDGNDVILEKEIIFLD